MTEEEKKEKQLEACKKWYWSHKELKNKKFKEWYNENKEKRSDDYKKWREDNKEHDKERHRQYLNTPMGRAVALCSKYRAEDKKHNRGEGDLTPEWIVENIFTKSCAHCGKTGWKVIGCNRLDNSKPHTVDNVEPCCKECNSKEYTKSLRKPLDQISPIDGEVVKTWVSATEAEEFGYQRSKIQSCCRGERKTHRGYIWKYIKMG